MDKQKEFKYLEQKIDHIDDNLLVLLASRMAATHSINELGPEYAVKNHDAKRQQQIINRLSSISLSKNLNKQAIKDIWEQIFKYTHKGDKNNAGAS